MAGNDPPDRRSLSPLALLGILASGLVLIVMSKKWKKSQAIKPPNNSPRSTSPGANSNQEQRQRQPPAPVVQHVPPTPTDPIHPNNGKENKLSGWKKTKRVLQVSGFIVLTLYTIFAGWQSCSMNRSVKLTGQQIADNEDSQAAQLAVTDISGTITPDPKFTYLVTVNYKLCNVGNSAANQIRVQSGTSFY